jgi:hypothetical protein
MWGLNLAIASSLAPYFGNAPTLGKTSNKSMVLACY